MWQHTRVIGVVGSVCFAGLCVACKAPTEPPDLGVPPASWTVSPTVATFAVGDTQRVFITLFGAGHNVLDSTAHLRGFLRVKWSGPNTQAFDLTREPSKGATIVLGIVAKDSSAAATLELAWGEYEFVVHYVSGCGLLDCPVEVEWQDLLPRVAVFVQSTTPAASRQSRPAG